MITTTRSERSNNELYYGNDNVNVAILEKERASSRADFSSNNNVGTEDYQQAKERMQKNLEKLLNYDRSSEIVEEQETVVETAPKACAEEDIRPSSTTMQFGDEDVNTMLNELRSEADFEDEEDASFKLNKKGKIVVALYSVCVAIVLALILLNTGLIALLSNQKEALTSQLTDLNVELNEVINEVAFEKAHTIDKAIEMGYYLPN